MDIHDMNIVSDTLTTTTTTLTEVKQPRKVLYEKGYLIIMGRLCSLQRISHEVFSRRGTSKHSPTKRNYNPTLYPLPQMRLPNSEPQACI